MTNQSDRSTPQFLHYILTTRSIFLELFYILFSFYATPYFYHKDGHLRYKSVAGREQPTAQRGPDALDYPKAARVRERLQLLPPFLGNPGREQSESLPTVETCELVIARQIRSKLFY